jgi:preprotein translocase subunit SecD
VAPPPGTLRVGRYFLALLGLLIVLYSLIVFPGQRHKPKLGIDLVGGIRVIFTAQAPKGAPPPSSSQMTQARQILEDRINTTGVTGATVVVQGSDQLVVEIPNGTGTDVARLGKAAVLNFRGIIAPAQPVTCSPTTTGATGTPSASATTSGTASPSSTATSTATSTASKSGSASNSPHAAAERLLTAPSSSTKPSPSGTAKSTPKSSGTRTGTSTTTPTATSTTTPPVIRCLADPISVLVKVDKSLKGKIPNAETCPSPGISDSKCRAYSALTSAQQGELSAALQNFDCSAAAAELDRDDRYYIACDTNSQFAYLLGHIVVHGRNIDSASAQAPDISGNGGSAEWTVRLTLGSTGADAWHAWTSKYHTDNQSVSPIQTSTTAPCGPALALPCSDFVAFTLDGQVISNPVTLAVLDTQTSISGNFTQTSANNLSRELNYGKLPLSFRAEENNKVSATLGSKQLHAAFLAGGIGLALVIIYSLLYYRGLGLVTIASLLVSGALTYAMLVILATQIGFTLDLAGIAGFIVALGITADSFVVFFERIKDEVHEGRSLRVAVPRAWVRARRTILSADTVSFLAAAILYYFASADVKGFAFTLGMSTILDLVVVFLFTHPTVSMLSRRRTFGSPRFTGLGTVRAGGIATSDDEPAPARKRPARTRRAAPADTPQGAVAVLEDEETQTIDEDEPETAAEPSDVIEIDGEPAPERRRTAPEPGTAAERAAARRARMRDESGGKEER